MSTSMLNINVLVDFDALFDTRMAVLGLQGNEVVIALMYNAKYHNRRSDDFTALSTLVNQDKFKLDYEKRGTDQHIRNNLTFTKILDLVRDSEDAFYTDNPTAVEGGGYNVHLNIYPFKLSDKEKVDLVEGFSELFLRPVKLVDFNPAILNPKYLRENYTSYVTYDFDMWLKTHIDRLTAYPIAGFEFVVPYLAKAEPTSKEDRDAFDSNKIMEDSLIILGPFMMPIYRTIADFCIG